jgi:leucyl aminopeptidase
MMQMMGHSELVGEYHWPLPLWSEYDYVLKSDRADMANIAFASLERLGEGKL